MEAYGNTVLRVKEEVTYDDEFGLYDLSAIDVKQEYHCKEEINLEWDEKDNDYAECESKFNNISQKASVKSESDNDSVPTLHPPTLKKSIKPKKPNALPKLIKRCCPKCDNLSEITTNFLYREKNCATCSTLSLMFQCAKCNKRYTKYDSIRYHVSSKCDPEEYHRCDFCDYGTTIRSQMAKHVKRVHEENNNCKRAKLKCEKCGKEFKYGYSLNRHAKKSCGLKYPKGFVECASCDKKFKNEVYLVEHEKVCGEEVRLRCDHCGFESKYKQRLVTHLRKRHSRGGRFEEMR